MAEQYCFLGWLHHILWPFILPTVKQQGIVEVHCSSSLFKLWSASPEAVPPNKGKQNRSLSLSAGPCSMQHCINAIAIILEWREKQNVQLKLCLVQFLTEFTTWERCQIEGFGKQSPPFNRSVRKEQEQPSKPPPRLPPQPSPAQIADAPHPTLETVFYRVGENLSLHTPSPLGLPPDISIHIRPCAFMMGPSGLLQTELEGNNFCLQGVWAGLES